MWDNGVNIMQNNEKEKEKLELTFRAVGLTMYMHYGILHLSNVKSFKGHYNICQMKILLNELHADSLIRCIPFYLFLSDDKADFDSGCRIGLDCHHFCHSKMFSDDCKYT